MSEGWLGFAGGIGLFLFGMTVMTEALKTLASGRMRAVLGRFTTTPLRGVLSGAIGTALMQSSSAVILTVIGFVGAGLMSFPQALGVIFGANIGSTTTGWVVAILGLKLQLGVVALPLLFVAALVATLTRGGRRQAGMALAGFSLIFLGLEMMQTATAQVSGLLAGGWLPGESWPGRLALVAIGVAVTVVIQSSGAGVAAVLVLLGSGSVTLMQAAALVVGMDLGTTAKSVLATLGGSREMRRTAMAHVGYNAVTDGLAFLALPLVPLIQRVMLGDAQTALVVFHTGFNLAGVALLLPVLPWFARGIERLVPGGTGPLPEPLDRRLLGDADVAQDAARGVAAALATVQCARLSGALRRSGRAVEAGVVEAVADLEDFLTRVALPSGGTAGQNRQAALLHLADHLGRLAQRAGQEERLAVLVADPVFCRPVRMVAAALERAALAPADPVLARRLARLHGTLGARMARMRRSVLLREHVGLVSPPDLFALTDALRWLERVLFHTERIVHYGAAAAAAAPPKGEATSVLAED
ncbi:phosphate:Na+ symporter [Gemmobacter aquatilis]|uniref:Phosphate:Na+ symporter n=1 Tax=Gemmobacter aquatilis TaxID=933059 RepID=A0A1H8L8Q3_9RHOB|nr:Na/Pi symporter [Gemmobacter aquatilis]SEO01560.1 phosphate:Na+ symporter [Gemmobacter aquatilis]